MLLLISDANILIDMDTGGLLAPMFSMEYRFAVPDVLYVEELEGQHDGLMELGLQSVTLQDHLVATVAALSQQYRRPSRNAQRKSRGPRISVCMTAAVGCLGTRPSACWLASMVRLRSSVPAPGSCRL